MTVTWECICQNAFCTSCQCCSGTGMRWYRDEMVQGWDGTGMRWYRNEMVQGWDGTGMRSARCSGKHRILSTHVTAASQFSYMLQVWKFLIHKDYPNLFASAAKEIHIYSFQASYQNSYHKWSGNGTILNEYSSGSGTLDGETSWTDI